MVLTSIAMESVKYALFWNKICWGWIEYKPSSKLVSLNFLVRVFFPLKKLVSTGNSSAISNGLKLNFSGNTKSSIFSD